MQLITDRTASDVEGLTEKGLYRSQDLNRVEAAAETLSQELSQMEDSLREYAQQKGAAWQEAFELPFSPGDAQIQTRVDWDIFDWPTKPQMRRYLQNIIRLCELLEVSLETLPESMEQLTYEGANEIERTLESCQAAAQQLWAHKRALIDSAAEEGGA